MVVYRFSTVNGTPIAFIEKIAEMYPNLSFRLSYGGLDIQCDASILFTNRYPLIWKTVEWDGAFNGNPEPHNFCDNFQKSLHNAFPGFIADPERVANEQVNNARG